MKYLIIISCFLSSYITSGQIYDYDIAVNSFFQRKITITNKSDVPLKILNNGAYLTLEYDESFIDTIESTSDGQVQFVQCKVYASHKLQYIIEKLGTSIKKKYQVVCYDSTDQTYKINRRTNRVESLVETPTSFDNNFLYVNTQKKSNSVLPKNNLNVYISPLAIKDSTLLRTLACVGGFMQVNYYDDQLNLVTNLDESDLQLEFRDGTNITSSITSCCSYRNDTIFIFNGVKYVEFPYLHEMLHRYGIEGDYSGSSNSSFIFTREEQWIEDKKYESIRSNFDLYTNRFKVDIRTLIFMLSK